MERAKQLVRGTQAQLDLGHGNPESLRRQLVSSVVFSHDCCMMCCYNSQSQHRKKLRPLQLMRRQYTLALDSPNDQLH